MDPRIAWYPPEHLGSAHDLWTRVWETQKGVDNMFLSSDLKPQSDFNPLDSTNTFDQKRQVLQNSNKNAENIQNQNSAQKRKRENKASTYDLNQEKRYLGEDGGLTPWNQRSTYDPNIVGCECGNCVTMEKAEEYNCCMKSHNIVEKLKKCRPKDKPNVTCVTQLRGFQSVCLDPDVLETAYLQYKEHGTMQATLEEKYRYTSYRQLLRWYYGVVGRKVRVPLPSCAVNAIHTAFPSEGPYTGFNWPELD